MIKACSPALIALPLMLAQPAWTHAQIASEPLVIELRDALPAERAPVPPKPQAEADAEADADDETLAPKAKPAKPGELRFHLMDGTVITGQLTAKTLPVRTEFGTLTVPIEAIVRFAPGLESHTDIAQNISQLITQLADPNAERRDQAQAKLIAFGPGLLPELQEHAKDPDPERRVRIAAIVEELYAVESDAFDMEQSPSVSLARLDRIVTKRFTIAGKIEQDRFTITSKFGELVVQLGDIKAVETVADDKPEVRRVVEVSGSDMTCNGYKKTGIRVSRGDRVIISAEGKITMSPWGNNSVSGPDGIARNGMYSGTIPMGALAGRIGDSGEEMLIGSSRSFVAKKSGVLYLGFAMQQNWANHQFPGSYKARVRVVPGATP